MTMLPGWQCRGRPAESLVRAGPGDVLPAPEFWPAPGPDAVSCGVAGALPAGPPAPAPPVPPPPVLCEPGWPAVRLGLAGRTPEMAQASAARMASPTSSARNRLLQ